MNIQYLSDFCADKITSHPKLQVQIIDFFMLAQDEIEEGGSEQHEVALAISSINELIYENK
jgi:hypothetical protein